MKFEQMPRPQSEAEKLAATKSLEKPANQTENKLLESHYSKEASDQVDHEFQQEFLATFRGKYQLVVDFARDLQERYGRERLWTNKYFHTLIGSTIPPGVKIAADPEVEREIREFVAAEKNKTAL